MSSPVDVYRLIEYGKALYSSRKYQIGSYHSLNESGKERLDAHPVGQAIVIKRLVATYNRDDRLAIRELRSAYNGIPNSAVRKLINLNKNVFRNEEAKWTVRPNNLQKQFTKRL